MPERNTDFTDEKIEGTPEKETSVQRDSHQVPAIFDVITSDPEKITERALIVSFLKDLQEKMILDDLFQGVATAVRADVISYEEGQEILMYATAVYPDFSDPDDVFSGESISYMADLRTFEARLKGDRRIRKAVARLFPGMPRALMSKKQFEEALLHSLSVIGYLVTSFTGVNYLRNEGLDELLEVLDEPAFEENLADAMSDLMWNKEEQALKVWSHMAVLLMLKMKFPDMYREILNAHPRSDWKNISWTNKYDEEQIEDLFADMYSFLDARVAGVSVDMVRALNGDDETGDAISTEEYHDASVKLKRVSIQALAKKEKSLDLEKMEMVLETAGSNFECAEYITDALIPLADHLNSLDDYLFVEDSKPLVLAALSFLESGVERDELINKLMQNEPVPDLAVLSAAGALLLMLSEREIGTERLDPFFEFCADTARKYCSGKVIKGNCEDISVRMDVLQSIFTLHENQEAMAELREKFNELYPEWKDIQKSSTALNQEWFNEEGKVTDENLMKACLQVLAAFLSEDWKYWLPVCVIYTCGYRPLNYCLHTFAQQFSTDNNPEVLSLLELAEKFSTYGDDEDEDDEDEEDDEEDNPEDGGYLEDILWEMDGENWRNALAREEGLNPADAAVEVYPSVEQEFENLDSEGLRMMAMKYWRMPAKRLKKLAWDLYKAFDLDDRFEHDDLPWWQNVARVYAELLQIKTPLPALDFPENSYGESLFLQVMRETYRLCWLHVGEIEDEDLDLKDPESKQEMAMWLGVLALRLYLTARLLDRRKQEPVDVLDGLESDEIARIAHRACKYLQDMDPGEMDEYGQTFNGIYDILLQETPKAAYNPKLWEKWDEDRAEEICDNLWLSLQMADQFMNNTEASDPKLVEVVIEAIRDTVMSIELMDEPPIVYRHYKISQLLDLNMEDMRNVMEDFSHFHGDEDLEDESFDELDESFDIGMDLFEDSDDEDDVARGEFDEYIEE